MLITYTDTDFFYNGTSVVSFSACDFPVIEGIIVSYQVININLFL